MIRGQQEASIDMGVLQGLTQDPNSFKPAEITKLKQNKTLIDLYIMF